MLERPPLMLLARVRPSLRPGRASDP